MTRLIPTDEHQPQRRPAAQCVHCRTYDELVLVGDVFVCRTCKQFRAAS